MTRYMVVARSDGRGGIRPFGEKGWGATTEVQIGKKNYQVTTDGRVNIPKKVMDDYGKLYKGRRVIEIEFSSKSGGKGTLASNIYKPRVMPHRKIRTGMKAVRLGPRYLGVKFEALEPMDTAEYTWSPD